ncbi:MAG TPA: LacI family DNA-binding transcriptional regulator [Candidatus Limnocylindrales bacterium]|nr:LacI family DNA-binding transcriptional regulator [Candidatus Limnocylindrales bacterium]
MTRSVQHPATLEQVAAAARVSRATASRVVNGDQRVGGEARAAVEEAIRVLGYVPNRAARSLVTRRSDSVAVVIPEPTDQLFGDPFFPRLLRGVTDVLEAGETQLVLLMPQSARDEDRLSRYLSAGHADGVLLASLHGDDPLPEDLQARGIPVVVGGRPRGQGITYVDVDNRGGAAAAVRHLLDAGRRRVATIAGPQDMPAGADRLGGYRDAIAGSASGQELIAEAGGFSFDAGRTAMEELLAIAPDLDAVFVASDLMALGAVTALRVAGRRVPQEVAVVGFDDSPLAETMDPPLSSVRQPAEEMGREMTRLLLDAIRRRGGPPRRVILDTQLVIRASSDGAALNVEGSP